MLSVIIRAKHYNKKGAELPTTNQKVRLQQHHKGYRYIISQCLPFVYPKGGLFSWKILRLNL
nr:MAG TPA: hypothetical protein [Caudoviricetes sp.]DAW29373.1 MAG TPA: hypothetical protein [Caudoviricetes sp.]DAX50887.1 MAG TPA: hypothetical protein [Bacteriophage sp.]